MNVLIILLFFLTIFGASSVQSFSGFGFGIFAMMFLPLLLPSYTVGVTVVGLLSIVISGLNAYQNYKAIHWKSMAMLFAAYMITSTISIFLLSSFADASVKRILGVVLILGSVYFLFLKDRLTLKPTIPNGLFAGSLSGLLGGLFSMGGPPVVIYLLSSTNDKTVYFATIQAFFFASSIYASIIRSVNGFVTQQTLEYTAIGLVAALLGCVAGKRIFCRVNVQTLRLTVYVLMAVSGVSAMIQ